VLVNDCCVQALRVGVGRSPDSQRVRESWSRDWRSQEASETLPPSPTHSLLSPWVGQLIRELNLKKAQETQVEA
jgi:hypothetical protein